MNTTPPTHALTSLSAVEMWLFETHNSTASSASAYIDEADGPRARSPESVDPDLPDPPSRSFPDAIVGPVLLRAA